jgi:hypothetical protein
MTASDTIPTPSDFLEGARDSAFLAKLAELSAIVDSKTFTSAQVMAAITVATVTAFKALTHILSDGDELAAAAIENIYFYSYMATLAGADAPTLDDDQPAPELRVSEDGQFTWAEPTLPIT